MGYSIPAPPIPRPGPRLARYWAYRLSRPPKEWRDADRHIIDSYSVEQLAGMFLGKWPAAADEEGGGR